MSSRVSIELHHHGDFTPNASKGNARYVGGTVDIIDILDPNKLTMYDLNKYALKYPGEIMPLNITMKNIVNFKNGRLD